MVIGMRQQNSTARLRAVEGREGIYQGNIFPKGHW